MVTKDLGMVTAYAYAVAGGYEGTEAEFEQLMADLAIEVDEFENFSVTVTTLPAGSSATASYNDGVLSLGIPKGDKGDKGNTGDTGSAAGFGTVSATVDSSIGTPSVEVTASGADTAKNFAFAFHNLKGQKGPKGDPGDVSQAQLDAAVSDLKSDLGELATEVEPTNLYDGSRWAVAGYLSDSGGGNATFVSANGYTTTNPIYLEAGDYVFTAYPYSYGANALFCFPCDEDGGNLKSVEGTNIGTTFDGYAIVAVTLSKSGYVRFNTKGLGASRDFMLAKGNSASDFPSAYTPYFTPFKQINNDVDVEAGSVIIKKQLMQSENLFNGEFYPVNGYLGGATIYPNDGYRITNPVYLEAGKYMYNSANAVLGGNAKSIVKCDADGSVLESVAVTATGGTVAITINGLEYEVYIADIHISGFYMFNCGNATRADFFMLVEGDNPTDFPSTYVQYWTPYNVIESGVLLNDEMLAQKSSTLKGKVLTVNGDSICEGAGYSGGYAKIIGELEKMSVQNIGVGGGTITAEQYSSGNVARHWVCRTISNMNADADYALLEGGVNDASLAVPLGSITNGYTATLDDTTFYGAMESCLKQLTTRFKGKKYGFIIVHQMSANYRIINEEATSYYWATVRCCEKWGVPYLDLNKAVPPFGIFPSSGESELKTMRDTYTLNGDGWHPTEAGYRDYYVPKIIAWMKTL